MRTFFFDIGILVYVHIALNMAETVLTSKIDNMVPEEVQKKLANLYNKYQQLSPEDKKKFQKNAIEMLTEAVEKPSNTVAPTGFMLYKPYIPFVFAASCVTFLLGTTSLHLKVTL